MQLPHPRSRNGHPEEAEWTPLDRAQASTDEGSFPPFAMEWDPEPRKPVRWWLHVGLFVLTALSCYTVAGVWYGVGIMAILLTHEMGHYLASRAWLVRASLPYFLPFPSIPSIAQSPIGTLGAVIVMKSRMPSRRALLDIGAAGPIAGFVVSVVVLAFGLSFSTIRLVPDPWPPPGYMTYVFGESLLFNGLRWLILGSVPQGAEVFLHPLARAGWVGLFVTALNLLPMGQLDGGHIVYALFRRHYRIIAGVTTVILIGLIFVSFVWILFALLAVAFGQRHPPPLDDVTPLGARRRRIGYLCIVILIVCFMPNPLDVIGIGF